MTEVILTREEAKELMGAKSWTEFLKRDEYYRKRHMVDVARQFGEENAHKPGLSFSMAEAEFAKFNKILIENLAYEIIQDRYQRFEYPRAEITEDDKLWMMAVYSDYGKSWGG